MANFVPDYGQTPTELIKALFLHDNPDLAGYTLSFSAPKEDTENAAKTTATVSIAEDVVDIKAALIKYTRISLPVLFSVVPLEVHGVHFNESGIIPVEANQYILDNFGLNVSEDFQYSKDEVSGDWYLEPLNTNLAFEDRMVINRIASLQDRVPVNVLEGFFAPGNDPIGLTTMREVKLTTLNGRFRPLYDMTLMDNESTESMLTNRARWTKVGWVADDPTDEWTEYGIKTYRLNIENDSEIPSYISVQDYMDTNNKFALEVIGGNTGEHFFCTEFFQDGVTYSQTLMFFDRYATDVRAIRNMAYSITDGNKLALRGHVLDTKLYYMTVGSLGTDTLDVLDFDQNTETKLRVFTEGGVLNRVTAFTDTNIFTVGADDFYYMYTYDGTLVKKVAMPTNKVDLTTAYSAAFEDRYIVMDEVGKIHVIDFNNGTVSEITNIQDTPAPAIIKMVDKERADIFVSTAEKIHQYELIVK